MKASRQIANSFRAIPSVDALVRELDVTDIPRAAVVAIARRELARYRAAASARTPGQDSAIQPLEQVRLAIENLRNTRIQPVINATGILIHTNLGRSPLGEPVAAALSAAALNYTNLEFDLTTGQRGQRGHYVEQNLAVLCGSEAATVVNNCAAALVLALHHFASRPPRNEVLISRGELIQIGGGFRIPDILEASGAKLREVGTTNKTSIDDYAGAIGPGAALILKVHPSNFYMGGFVEAPSTEDLARLAKQHEIPLLEDLGSGATFDTTTLGGPESEPTPRQALAAGADLVCFSGDKLLGGPQAGIIAGSAPYVARLKNDPFFRALRCDKLILAALETTVDLLLSEQIDEIPIRSMMQSPAPELAQRARHIAGALAGLPVSVQITAADAQIGGGSLPRTLLPSVTIKVQPADASGIVDKLAARLRHGRPAVISYIKEGALFLDLRTVFPRQDQALITAVRAALENPDHE